MIIASPVKLFSDIGFWDLRPAQLDCRVIAIRARLTL
jgi:hypothetical protein